MTVLEGHMALAFVGLGAITLIAAAWGRHLARRFDRSAAKLEATSETAIESSKADTSPRT